MCLRFVSRLPPTSLSQFCTLPVNQFINVSFSICLFIYPYAYKSASYTIIIYEILIFFLNLMIICFSYYRLIDSKNENIYFIDLWIVLSFKIRTVWFIFILKCYLEIIKIYPNFQLVPEMLCFICFWRRIRLMQIFSRKEFFFYHNWIKFCLCI